MVVYKMLINKIYVLFFISLITFICHMYIVECNSPTYAITAPKIIRPRDEYSVIVSLHNVTKSTEVLCDLRREQYQKDNSKSESDHSDKRTFPLNDLTQVFNKQVDKSWTEGEYKLYVNGTGGINFTEVIDITLVYKQFVILVQSDKAIYKPGDTVLFRVLILEGSLLPVSIEDILDLKIYIIDPLDNKLRLFSLKEDAVSNDTDIYGTNEIGYSKGVTNDISFTLENEAMLGEWQIQVVTRGQVQNYNFFVDHYQLPLANVTITLPAYITYSNMNLKLKVDCFYTFGKPVRGSVKVLITKSSECGRIVKDDQGWSKDYEINGQILDEINVIETRLLNPKCSEMRLNVTAIVYDKITESNYSNFEVLDVYQKDIRTQLISKQTKFKPGKTIRQHTKILSLAGGIIEKNIIENIKCEAQFQTSTGEIFTTIIPPNTSKNNDANIVCDFKTNITTTNMSSRLKYDENILLESYYSSFQSCSSAFVQVMLREPLEQLKADQTINLVITSNEPIKQLVYYIVVRGSIVAANPHEFVSSSEIQILPIILKRRMVPEAIIAVFFASPNTGVIVSDALTLQITGLFHYEVAFNVTTPLVDASQEAVMFISAEEESRLYILGVDEAVLALKQGNDIIEERVLKELQHTFTGRDSVTGFLQSGMEFRSNTMPECNSYYDLKPLKPHVDPEDKTNKNDNTINLRKNFRETWIWDTMTVKHGKHRVGVSANVPDSLTSWRVTAFSIHEQKGLGLTRLPGHVTVFRPFFIKLNIPYSIKREETSEIHVLAFNYLNVPANVVIKVKNNDTEHEKDISLEHCSFEWKMSPNEIKTFSCNVTAHNIGEFNLLAEATAKTGSNSSTDGELRSLIVVHEGFVQHMSKSILFDLTNDNSRRALTETLKIEYPKEALNGTVRVFASATAELITTPWKDELQQMIDKNSIHADFSPPTGCCQQRTIYHYPKVYWLDYLIKSKKATKKLTELAVENIEKTLQKLCPHSSGDGSYVTWYFYTGQESSVWQTAYTLKLLYHAKEYVTVDPDMIIKTESWLKNKQGDSGEFLETDIGHQIINTTDFNTYLTAFVYIALSSNDNKEVSPKAVPYFARKFDALTHPLDIVITCYALHIANHKNRNICYDKVYKMSVSINGMRYWRDENKIPDLQISSYALMILNNRKSNAIALEVFKYLLSRQHPNGWFIEGESVFNSLTTVICTEAMTQYISLMSNYDLNDENIEVNFKVGVENKSLHIKPENNILQSFELSQDTKDVEITASGYGRAVARISWQFNTKESRGTALSLKGTKKLLRADKYISLEVCTKYTLEGKVRNVILEIDLPSGYKFDKDSKEKVSELVDHIEPTNDDTHINIYLKEVSKTEICVSIPAIQSFNVMNAKASLLKIYPAYSKTMLTLQTV